MDVLTLAMAANKAVGVLENGGRIAKLTKTTRQHTFSVSLEEMDGVEGAYGAIIEGTLGVKESDSAVSIHYKADHNRYHKMCDDVPVESPLWIGNRGLADPAAENTTGMWLVIIDFDKNASLILCKAKVSYEFTVVIDYDKITPIDPKYLPGVCLPVVEFTTDIFTNGATCTAEESAALTALAKTQMPVVAKVTMDSDVASILLCYQLFDGVETFMFSMLGIHLQMSQVNGEWKVTYLE